MATNNSINTPSPINVANGGTGDSSITAYSVVCGGTTNTGSLQVVSGLGTSGQTLISNGASALPTWQFPVMPSATTISGTTYTLALADAEYFQICSNVSAQTITVPTNASIAFPVNTEIVFFQQGAGQVIFTAAGGVTIQSISSNLKISAQYGVATLKQIASDTWALFGSLSA